MDYTTVGEVDDENCNKYERSRIIIPLLTLKVLQTQLYSDCFCWWNQILEVDVAAEIRHFYSNVSVKYSSALGGFMDMSI